jgi:hypothetical protein
MEMAMDCAQFEEIVHDLERLGTQGFALRLNALAHAESCGRCSLLLEEVSSLDFALDGLAVQDCGEGCSPRVEAAVLAEFRKQHEQTARPRRDFQMAALAAAAVLILVLGLGVRYWTAQRSEVAQGNPTPVTSPAAVSPEAQTNAGTEQGTGADDSEYATNFVSLPYADDPGSLEGSTVVRVTLSRAALASFGVPVADLSTADRIPAEIALSEDGVPQAIRLVADADFDQAN